MSEAKLREQICAIGKSLFERGLTAGSSGNISVRLDQGWLLTPTNSSLGRLDPARLAKLDDAGNLLSGDPPSKELPLHRAFYGARGPARAIVHLHSTHSVAVSVLNGIDPANAMPAITAYQVMKVGRLPVLPYFRPGDANVASAIAAEAPRHAAVLLANHGPVVSGVSLDAASDAIEELEETAKLFLLLQGRKIRTLSDAQIEELRRAFGANW
jgi:3-dehydro-4-phosphotetronate decarboxylase